MNFAGRDQWSPYQRSIMELNYRKRRRTVISEKSLLFLFHGETSSISRIRRWYYDCTMGVARIFFSGGGNTFSKKISKNSQKIFKKISKNCSKKFKKYSKNFKKFSKKFKKFSKKFQKLSKKFQKIIKKFWNISKNALF